MLNFVILSVFMQNVFILSVIMLNVIMLRVLAPLAQLHNEGSLLAFPTNIRLRLKMTDCDKHTILQI
jgi:hypothetical protein